MGKNMINFEKLKPIFEGYKTYFINHWDDEKYKWKAVKHFQENWNIDAENFGDMFKIATDKTYNLLASGYAYPKGMIINFAKADDEGTRQMFRELFDESRDLAERVDAFQTASETMRLRYDDGTWRNHYQNTNAISTYLWLMFPDKYYIYKYELIRDTASEIAISYKPKRNGSVESLIGGYKMYDEICEAIQDDTELCLMLSSTLTDDCYSDPDFKTVTIDFAFYLSRFYLPEQKNAKDWFPPNYSPEISVEEWLGLLKDPSVFTLNALQIMKRMQHYGGQATCIQLSLKYGETVNFYNRGSSALGRRIAEKTGCPIRHRDDGTNSYWPILYLGKNAGENVDGTFIWRLRPELYEALSRLDLSEVPLYVHNNNDAEIDSKKQSETMLVKYTKEDFLNEVFMSSERYDVLESLVRNKMNVILQGAPGVGKTFAAKKLAYAMMGEVDDSRIEIVQFHQNYSYEDFIMGYRPDGVGFKLTDGIFYRFCKTASHRPDQEYFFIIDEINRGNMSKIFGELLMLIERDYRGTKATLAYSGTAFSVPKNLYLIGMMNTADRSLAMIDYALRRRFSFFEMEPGFNSDGFKAYQESLHNETFNTLIERIKELNKEIVVDDSLGEGFRIGHSYFCGQEECTDEWMKSIVYYDIIPMLQEYWFDDKQKLKRWENALSGVFND